MYAGRIVETGTVQEVLTDPKHPYTKGMLSSTVHGNMRGQDIEAIPGSPPDLRALPTGCSFGPRCAFADSHCLEQLPPEVMLGNDRLARCFKVDAAPAAADAGSVPA